MRLNNPGGTSPVTLYLIDNNFGPESIPGTDIQLMKNSAGENIAILFVSGRHDGGQSYICHWDPINQAFDTTSYPCQPFGPANANGAIGIVGDFGSGSKADIAIVNSSCGSGFCPESSHPIVLYLAKEHYKKEHPLTAVTSHGARAAIGINGDNGDHIVLGMNNEGGQNNVMLFKTKGQFKSVNFPNMTGGCTVGLAPIQLNGKNGFITGARVPYASFPPATAVDNLYMFQIDAVNDTVDQISTFGSSDNISVGIAVGSLDNTGTQYIVVANGGDCGYTGNPWLFSLSDSGQVTPITSTVITTYPHTARPAIIYDIDKNGLNEIFLGNENCPGQTGDYSLIYMNQGNLNFVPIAIPGSDQYQPRGAAMGEFMNADGSNQQLLIMANYCGSIAANDEPISNCYSKFLQISSVSPTKVTTTIKISISTGFFSGLFSNSNSNQSFMQLYVNNENQYAITAWDSQNVSQTGIVLETDFSVTPTSNIVFMAQNNSGTYLTANCPAAVPNNGILSYNIGTNGSGAPLCTIAVT
jgi:hypothetical protein